MRYTIAEIADALDARAVGDTTIEVNGLAEPSEAGPSDLALALSSRFSEGLAGGDARAAIITDSQDWQALGLKAAILVTRSRYALAQASGLFPPEPDVAKGVHRRSAISTTSSIGDPCAIGPFVAIADDVAIGNHCIIGAGVSIGRNVRIGDRAVIGPGVHIGRDTVIGSDFIAQPNAVIGSDGFAYAAREEGAVNEVKASLTGTITAQNSRYRKINSLGRVVIGDDVEVGAGATIDRGTISETRIGDRTKLDNNVHIAHNVIIGSDCLICGLCGIAGSAKLGDRVVLGGMCGVKDHVRIGDDVLAAGASKMFTDVPQKTAVMGSPALPMNKFIEIYKLTRRLPRLVAGWSKSKNATPRSEGKP